MPAKVSIIVTCYNLARYIGEALSSVAAQDYPGDWQVIVVDDASTDDSAAEISKFEGVQLVRLEENSGSMLALLAGLEQARGDLLFFLDGDDTWEPGKLGAAVHLFDREPAMVFATHDLQYIDAAGRPIARGSRVAEVMNAIAPEGWSEAIRAGILGHDDYVWLGSAFAVRRSLARLDEYVRFVRALADPRSLYQDWPLAYWCASLPGPLSLGFIPEKLFRYRLHQANHSGEPEPPPARAATSAGPRGRSTR